jgi:UDP:flavonoid glycosyltransferase YjiC (YdhE family)
MLAIPNNIDNHLSTALMEEHKTGIGIRVEHANTRRIRGAIARLMEDPSYKNSAMKWSRIIRRYDWKQIFPQILTQWFAVRQKPSPTPETIREVCTA